jgi:hypothetical protein
MEFIALLFFHSALHTRTHARTDTHKGLLISWPFLYSWYVVGEEMIGQIRHLISCHTERCSRCNAVLQLRTNLHCSSAAGVLGARVG